MKLNDDFSFQERDKYSLLMRGQHFLHKRALVKIRAKEKGVKMLAPRPTISGN